MPINVKCSACGNKFKVKDEHAGKKGKCTKCKSPVRVPHSDPVVQPAVRPIQPIAINVVQSPTNSTAVTALVVGVLSIVLCWLPFVGLAIGSLGMLLAIVAFVKGRGLGYVIGGGVLSAISVLVGIGIIMTASAFVDAVDRAVKSDLAPTAEQAREWTDISKPLAVGSFRLELAEAKIRKVNLTTILGTDRESKDELLLLRFRITNTEHNKIKQYTAMHEDSFRSKAVVTDNFGNKYNKEYSKVAGGGVFVIADIRPGQSVDDAIAFEKPLDNATHLEIMIPADRFDGEKGSIRFRISHDSLKMPKS